MTAIELKMSLLQEVMSLEDEKLIKKALNSVRRMKMATFGKATPVEKSADDYVEPTKEGDLGGAKECPARREGLTRGQGCIRQVYDGYIQVDIRWCYSRRDHEARL